MLFKLRNTIMCAIISLAVSAQECTDAITTGSLNHNDNIVIVDHTFILTEYALPCSGTVVAWEFCYRISGASSLTFYPGIWRMTRPNSGFTLVQANTITYNSVDDASIIYPCKVFSLPPSDWFIAPAGSVVGLYSNTQTQLLHTNTDRTVTTYMVRGNHSSISDLDHDDDSDDDVDYNIAIRVHLGKHCISASIIMCAYVCVCCVYCVHVSFQLYVAMS